MPTELPVYPKYALHVVRWVPTSVEYDDPVRRGQVDSQATGARGYEEQSRPCIGRSVEYLAPYASVLGRGLTVQAEVVEAQGPAAGVTIQCLQRRVLLCLVVYSREELFDQRERIQRLREHESAMKISHT